PRPTPVVKTRRVRCRRRPEIPIPPRVAREELVGPDASHHDLDVSAGELGSIEIGIADPEAWLLEVPYERRQGSGQRIRAELDLVVPRPEQPRERAGMRSLVKAALALACMLRKREAASESVEAGSLPRGYGSSGGGVDSAAQVSAERDVASHL